MSDRQSLRIAVVLQTPKDPQSAVYITYQSLAVALERLGHSTTIVSPADFPGLRKISGRWVPLGYPIAVASWLRRHRRDFDLVIFHSYAGWLATASTGAPRPRRLVMFHGLEPLYHQELREEAIAAGRPLSWRYRFLQEVLMPQMLRIACRSADDVACLNRAEADFLARRGWVSSRGARVLAHGVPDEFFGPRRDVRPLRSLLFIGQWLPMKGVRYLREAIVTLLSEDPALRVTCAGTLVSEDVVLAEFPADLRPRITVRPRVEQPALVRLYREADAFIFPSLYEGFSRAILEAMAARLPIVTTSVGVAADALRAGESAIFVPKRDGRAIVTAVRALQADPGFAARLGEAAAAAAGAYRLDLVEPQTVNVILEAAGAVA